MRLLQKDDVFEAPALNTKRIIEQNGHHRELLPFEFIKCKESGFRFIVVKAERVVGGAEQPRHGSEAEGHKVVARLLTPDGRWDAFGLKVTFYQTGDFNHGVVLCPSRITLIDKMLLVQRQKQEPPPIKGVLTSA